MGKGQKFSNETSIIVVCKLALVKANLKMSDHNQQRISWKLSQKRVLSLKEPEESIMPLIRTVFWWAMTPLR